MARSLKNEDRLTEYLLGLMSEEEQMELEEVYLFDDERNLELQAAERDLIDTYLEGSLSEMERNRFEKFFLCSPGRMEKLQFARALKAYGTKPEAFENNAPISRLRGFSFFVNSFIRPYVGIVALAVLLGIVGLV